MPAEPCPRQTPKPRPHSAREAVPSTQPAEPNPRQPPKPCQRPTSGDMPERHTSGSTPTTDPRAQLQRQRHAETSKRPTSGALPETDPEAVPATAPRDQPSACYHTRSLFTLTTMLIVRPMESTPTTASTQMRTFTELLDLATMLIVALFAFSGERMLTPL